MLHNIHLINECTLSDGGFPQVPSFSGPLPGVFVGFNYINQKTDDKRGLHFYVDDYQFERLWRSPELYLHALSRFSCIISPDFSMYIDMPQPMKIWNTFRNRFFAAWWQTRGLNVIPNVSWADPDSYKYCFEGLPVASIIAVNSMGVCKNSLSKYLWRKGYDEALSRLNPTMVLRYGHSVEGEDTSRTIFIKNTVIERMHNGR